MVAFNLRHLDPGSDLGKLNFHGACHGCSKCAKTTVETRECSLRLYVDYVANGDFRIVTFATKKWARAYNAETVTASRPFM